ncbi:MAG: sugar ABC transporter ATP-binding protein [Candidatus Symbiobacter sp.]|nr:sugar ABC transporter ATP-binding protein [Candidatus Symbiobacter sp.]
MSDKETAKLVQPILEMRKISKSFHGVAALSQVNLTVMPGQIHAVVGENGAGKSTLMKILSGVYPYGDYKGEIFYQGKECRFSGISDSEKHGIIIIHQELALIPLLSIAENIFIGHEVAKSGVINWAQTYSKSKELLLKVGMTDSPSALITNIGVGKQQLVEIAKALSKQVKLLILDEPTASLNETDSNALLDLLLGLKQQGISCILISHKLNEISRVADEVTVLRDGSTVANFDCRQETLSEDVIIKHMVGREMANRYPPRTPNIGEVMFEVKNWRVFHAEHADRELIKSVNFNLKRGEIVGIAGLMGAGRTELAMSIFGQTYGRGISGEIWLHGSRIDTSSVQKAINHGIAYVTEDRKGYGLVLNESAAWNTSLAYLKGVSRRGVINDGKEYSVAERFRQTLSIKCPDVFARVVNLSGGNQQKIVLSKWLFSEPEILILDEPTRGIDVGAKYEIYTIIAKLAAEGKAVLVISSEMPELLGMCDRIYVLNDGRFVAEMPAAEASQEKIMKAIVSSGGN